jgi:hypothetical protein
MAGHPRIRRFLAAGAILISLAMVGAVAYSWLVGTTKPSQAEALAPGLAGSETRALRALAPATHLATQWQADARLSGVSGQQLEINQPAEKGIVWTFQFFSPSTQRLAIVAVEDGTARMVRPPALSPYSVPVFPDETWQVDSDTALLEWWNRGGRNMVNKYPRVDLMVQLRLSQESDRPTWMVAGVASGTNTSFAILVDATDGTVSMP